MSGPSYTLLLYFKLMNGYFMDKTSMLICSYEKCKKQASYNVKYQPARYCSGHADKKNGMRHVYKTCPSCWEKTMNFAKKGETKATHCGNCAKKVTEETGVIMVNVNASKCIECGLCASFGKEGTKKATHCSECAEKANDKDSSAKIVSFSSKCVCGKHRPSFGLKGGQPTHCAQCKKEAENPDELVFLKGRICNAKDNEKCNERARWGYEGGKSMRCKNHIKHGMIYLHMRTCQKILLNGKQCSAVPKFNREGETYGIYCGKHKLSGMFNVRAQCKAEWCTITGNKNYDDYCTNCFVHLFPHDPRVHQIQTKSKELKVRDFVNLHFDGFVHDKPLWTNDCDCSHRRRVDLRKLVCGTLLGIEVDEHQHSGYNKHDEEARYNDIKMVHGGNMIFVRYNPDHKDANLEALRQEIEKQMQRIQQGVNKDPLEIVYLFYRGK